MFDVRIISAGDIVVCIDSAPPVPCEARQAKVIGRLKQRAMYRVKAVVWINGARGLHLQNLDHKPTDGWRADRFRKILPADPAFCEAVNQRELVPL